MMVAKFIVPYTRVVVNDEGYIYTAKNSYLIKMTTSAWLLQFQGSLNK